MYECKHGGEKKVRNAAKKGEWINGKQKEQKLKPSKHKNKTTHRTKKHKGKKIGEGRGGRENDLHVIAKAVRIIITWRSSSYKKKKFAFTRQERGEKEIEITKERVSLFFLRK